MPERPTIVIVDDAADVRRVIGTRLRVSGELEVVGEASDGVEAVKLAEEHAPSLMLLDVSMPVMDGLEALPRVLEVSPSTRVVLFSGFEEQGLVDRALALGAADFFEKSVPLDLLVLRLLDLSSAAPAGVSSSAGRNAPGDNKVLTEHLERFREVFDEAAIGMATMTLAGRLVRVNRAFAALVDRPETDLVGQEYADLVLDTGDSVADALAGIRGGPVDIVQLEHGITSPDSDRLVRATLAPVRDSKGQALYVFVQLQDVTAEQAALRELRRSEERFRLLVAAVEDYAIFMLDPTGHIVSWNAGAQRSKLYTAEEIIGQHFRVFYPPELQESRHPEFELEAALRDGHYEEEGWRVRKDGSRFWANVLITAVHDADGRHLGFAKVTRDTSHRRRLEQDREGALKAVAKANAELESLNARLRQAADDQAQFLAVTAHELRTPISLLAGSADLLAKHGDRLSDEERSELLDSMSSGASRLRRLVGDLLTASKLQASALDLRTETVTVADAVSRAVTTVRSARPDVDVVVDDLAGATVEADRDRLEQMLENLLLNAIRHGVPPVHVRLEEDDALLRILVTDEGTGVPEAQQPRLFQRFATGKARGGTGLGLYIVRQLARVHGGEATYEPPSEEQPAGTFVLSLPRRHADRDAGPRLQTW
jgi:PAS domain S-box-containing protein